MQADGHESAARVVLHVGCGPRGHQRLPEALAGPDWREIRFDVDPAVDPDVVGSMTHLDRFEDASIDAIYSSHSLEHLFEHEVVAALREFSRVTKPDGIAVVTCPDLQSVAEVVAEDKLVEPAYVSAWGPIGPLDMLYGYRPLLARGNHFMAHRYGFTLSSLLIHLREAGYGRVGGIRLKGVFELWAVAARSPVDDGDMLDLIRRYLPASRDGLPVVA